MMFRLFPWKIQKIKQTNPQWLVFLQTGKYKNYAYSLSIKVIFDSRTPNYITINYILKNTGRQILKSDFYCHPFFKLNSHVENYWYGFSASSDGNIKQKKPYPYLIFITTGQLMCSRKTINNGL
jgi:hypothetical protein